MGYGQALTFTRILAIPCLVAGQALLASSPALARQDLIPGSRYTSGRGAAMGDAVLPLGDDGASGLFYNPANLAKLRKTSAETLHLTTYVNQGWVSMGGQSGYKVASLNQYESVLASSPGTYGGAGYSLLPNFYTRYFAFGFLLQNQVGAVENEDQTVRSRATFQMIPTIGSGIRLARGIVRLGYSLQWVNEASGETTTTSTDPNLAYSNGVRTGSGFSHNIGMALTFPWQYLPQFNVVARNVGGVRWMPGGLASSYAKNSAGTLGTEPMTVDASVSLQPKAGGGAFNNYVLELRDASNTSATSLMARLALGFEFSIREVLFLRAGYSNTYPSLGIGLRRKKSELGLSWYSEELGKTSGAQRDTRFMLSYQVGAF